MDSIKPEQGWTLIHKGIIKLQNLLEEDAQQQFSSDEYIILYTTIYDMCLRDPDQINSQMLYDRYKKSFEDYINSMGLPALRGKYDEFMLRELVKRWENHKIMVRWLSSLFNYLDRCFTERNLLPALSEAGLICFRDHFYIEMKNDIKDVVIMMIHQEREGNQIDRALLNNVLGIFVAIGLSSLDAYESDFEMAMLTDTASYYSRKGASWIEEDSWQDYLLKVEESLKREKERVGHYLQATSEKKLLEKVQQELLSEYKIELLLKEEHSGCPALFRNDNLEHLSRMYRLFCRIPNALEPMAALLRQRVIEEGTALVNQAEDAASSKKDKNKDTHGQKKQSFVRNVIELHVRYLHYVSECFVNNSLFHMALKEAFGVICNKRVAGSTSAELLATFCDNLLTKGGSEKLSDETVEDTIENVVKLLAYISDKDLFAEFHRRKLARRLIFDKYTNDDHERSILAKLKQQWGVHLTSKMEGMVTDLTLARESQTSFEDYLNDYPASNPGFGLTVMVLTTGFWPSYKSSQLALPVEMVKCVEVFKEFYQTKTKNKKLNWIYSLGTCHLNGKFDSKPIELIVTTYQAAVLLLFNAAERINYADIKEQLNLPDQDIVRLLHSLSCAKYKILNKVPGTKTVSATDSFEFNTKFSDKMRRIKIPLLPIDEKKVIENVDRDRRYVTDASLVQIMKSRKNLSYQQLLLECVQHLGQMFKPEIKVIKARIEVLIALEYLERDKDNPNIFRYLA